MKQKINWTIEQDEYIEKYYLVKSDEEIADYLNLKGCQVRARRIKLGFKKQRQTFNKKSPEGMKWCWYCNMFHPIDEFNKNKSKQDGYQDECRKAVKLIVLNRKSKKKNKVNNTIKEKKCTQCGEVKLINNFIKNVSTQDGYSNLCITCLNEKENIIKKFKTVEDK